MKGNFFKLLIITFLSLVFLPAWSQFKTKEEAIHRIFTVLQQKDEAGFVKLFPDHATMVKFVEKLYKSDTTGNPDIAEVMNAFLNEMTDSSLQAEFRRDFQSAIKKGELKGIDWGKTRFVSFTSDSTYDPDAGAAKLEGKIYFNIEAKEFFIAYDEVIWFDKAGWYGVSIRRVDEKSKENDSDDDPFLIEEMDSTVMADTAVVMIDSVEAPARNTPAPPVKKAPVKKTGGKSATTPTSQTPLKKED